jgi:DNA ligase (NAD+)
MTFQPKTFCFTGKSEAGVRAYMELLVKDAQCIVSKTVSRNTDYLVTNTPYSGSSKNQAAKRFGTKVLSEKEFFELEIIKNMMAVRMFL